MSNCQSRPTRAQDKGLASASSALTVSVLSLLLAAAAVAPAVAQGPPPSEELRWSLGVGVLSSPRPYVGAANQTRLIPVLDLEYKRFFFRGLTAGLELLDRGRFSLDLIGQAQLGGYEESDSDFLGGLERRRETLELGFAAALDLGEFDLEATLLADALGRSNGVQAGVELTWAKIVGRGRGGFFPGVGLIWQDAAFVDYYAGVRPEEIRVDRPAFEGSAAINLGAGLRGFWKVTERLRLFALLRLERLAGAYGESPIIDSRWGYFGLMSIAYEF